MDRNNPSKVENAKANGNHLRGTIDTVLSDSAADKFEHDDLQLLKFHGSYQQDDRDLRKARRDEGLGRAYSFMLRVTLPAGELTAQQYLDLDRIADEFANGTLRITTRQAIQFHGVIKSNLRATMQALDESAMTTLAACGDVCRNVMAVAAPFADSVHETIRATAREIAVNLRPATNAYHEIWLDGKRAISSLEEEPFYGETYLPRKYKVGVTVEGDNQIDVYSYDAGLIGVLDESKTELVGYNLVAGGGLGMSHGRANTFAQIASQIGFVSVSDGVAAIRTVASIYRDFGNRSDRKHARLKYLIDEQGIDWFRDEFKQRSDFSLQPWRQIEDAKINDWLGKHEQGDGKFFYGVFVENGRIKDTPEQTLRSALREIVQTTQAPVVLTAQQSLLFRDLTNEQVLQIETILTRHNVPLVNTLSAAVRYSMACPALPTCGMAVAESERAAPGFLRDVETLLSSLGMRDEPLTIRMTGCPNGCARPYTADIALVGRRPGIYHIFVGGRLAGDRMADLYAADVRIEEATEVLFPLLKRWSLHRNADEGLGDFYQRVMERDAPRTRITGKETPTFEMASPKLVQLGLSPALTTSPQFKSTREVLS